MKFIYKNIIKITILLYSLPCIGMDKVPILTSDGKELNIGRQVLEQSETLNNLLHDAEFDSNNPIPLPISSPIFTDIALLLFTPYYAAKFENESQTSVINVSINYLKTRAQNKDQYKYLIDIFNAANFLACQSALSATSSILADNILQELQTNQGDIDSLLQKVTTTFDIPDELSVSLGRDIIAKSDFAKHLIPIKEIINHCRSQNKKISALCQSPDFQLFAYALPDDGIYIIDLLEGTKRKIEKNGTVNVLSFSPDKTYIVAASENTQKKVDLIQVWSLTHNWNQLISEVKRDSIYSLAFSHDNKEILSNNINNTISIWPLAGTPCSRKKTSTTNKSAIPVVFDINHNLIPDPMYIPNKIVALYNSLNSTLEDELNMLKAEYATLFVWLIQSFIKNGTVTINDPKTQQFYNILIQNKSIHALFEKKVTLKNEYINYFKNFIAS